MRGVAQDVGNWMMHGAGPFSTNCTDKERAAGCMLGVTEAVLNGTTTIGEDGNNIPELFSYIEKLGVRGNISIRVREALPLIMRPENCTATTRILASRRLATRWMHSTAGMAQQMVVSV